MGTKTIVWGNRTTHYRWSGWHKGGFPKNLQFWCDTMQEWRTCPNVNAKLRIAREEGPL